MRKQQRANRPKETGFLHADGLEIDDDFDFKHQPHGERHSEHERNGEQQRRCVVLRISAPDPRVTEERTGDQVRRARQSPLAASCVAVKRQQAGAGAKEKDKHCAQRQFSSFTTSRRQDTTNRCRNADQERASAWQETCHRFCVVRRERKRDARKHRERPRTDTESMCLAACAPAKQCQSKRSFRL